ncbi:MAG: ATP synthase F1 subunit gamma [Deltaproteobacteria bacterium]|nr:ATP synthase F1 subunit gamma [Deltaproteobacteria bacterium]
MATLKDILRKIGAVKKTQQITRAMNMVAAAKLRSTQGKVEAFDPYAAKFAEVLENLASRIDPDIHPLLVKKESVSQVELLHFTADRGLCGSFNAQLIHRGEKWLSEQRDQGNEASMTVVGKKGRDYFKKRDVPITEAHVQVYGKIDMSFVNQMTRQLTDRFLNDELDEVYMMYTRFVSMARQEVMLVKLLPVEPPQVDEQEESTRSEYLCEPSAEELMIDLLPKHISVQIYNAFLQNEVSEHAARMAAMDNATKNCKELIQNLTLAYNKARQAAITAELMDIVGGAEAIKTA